MRGGCEAAHVYPRAGGKVNAVGVGQKYLAVGIDLPEDLAGVAALHAVEQHAAGAGLGDIDPGVGAHIEALPVDDGLVGALLHGHAGGGSSLRLAEADSAGGDLRACGQLVDCGGRDQRRRRQYPAGACYATGQQRCCCDQTHGTFFAACAHMLGHSHPGVECFAVNQFVAAVHELKRL